MSTETAAAPRYCATCKHCSLNGTGSTPQVPDYWTCEAPGIAVPSLVSGVVQPRYCRTERNFGVLCGPNGEKWEESK